MSATYGDQNTRADYMPHNIATAWVNYDFTSLGVTGLTLGTGVRYRGTSINTATKDKVDDVLLWDAAASWKIDNHWKLNGRSPTSLTKYLSPVHMAILLTMAKAV